VATLRDGSDDPLLRQDAERVPPCWRTRRDQNWADSVAGDMERHYSPGRTWEALARSALPLLAPGDVLDIASGDGVLAELLAAAFAPLCLRRYQPPGRRRRRGAPAPLSQCRSACRRHACPALRRWQLRPGRADARAHLCASRRRPVAEAARVLKRGGRLLLSSLAKHEHRRGVEAYSHVNWASVKRTAQVIGQGSGLMVSTVRNGHARTPPAAFRSHRADGRKRRQMRARAREALK
jgi:ArsR family transcriptional regulator